MNGRSKIRKLTNNEIILTIILCTIILLLVGFKYMVNPQKLKISALESQRDALKLKSIENNRMIKNREVILNEKSKLLIEKENIKKEFFRSLDQPHIIYLLSELLLKGDIEINDISFSKPFTENLNNQELKKMDILIPFEGSFVSFNDIIKKLKQGNKKIVVSNIDIKKGEDKEIIGSIGLGIYSLIDPTEKRNDNFSIESTNDNKSNPFIPYKGYVNSNNIKEDSSEEILSESEEQEIEKNLLEEKYEIYEAIKGDNISYISMMKYGTEKYVDEILRLNNMERFNILPIGKKLKLRRR